MRRFRSQPRGRAEPGRGASSGAIAYRALHLLVPLALGALVVSAVGVDDVLARVASAEPGWMLAALLVCSGQIVLSALRWSLTARRLGVSLSPGRALSEYYLSCLINTTVPGGVVGDALRAVRTRGAAGLERAAQAVMIERLAGQIVLVAVLLLGLAVSGRPDWQTVALLAAGCAAILGLGLAMGWGGPAARVLPSVLQRFFAAIRQCWFDRHTGPLQIALSLAIVALNLAAFAFAAVATGVQMSFVETMTAVPLILAAMLIPFSVAGWGYREGAAAVVFPLIGTSAAAGVGASVVFGVVVLVASLPGFAVVLVRRRASQAVSRRLSAP